MLCEKTLKERQPKAVVQVTEKAEKKLRSQADAQKELLIKFKADYMKNKDKKSQLATYVPQLAEHFDFLELKQKATGDAGSTQEAVKVIIEALNEFKKENFGIIHTLDGTAGWQLSGLLVVRKEYPSEELNVFSGNYELSPLSPESNRLIELGVAG